MASSPESRPPFSPESRWSFLKRAYYRVTHRGVRGYFWGLLDYLEERPALMRTLFIVIPVILVLAGAGIWGYLRWSRMNTIRIGRQWLEAGRLDRAQGAVEEAIANDPQLPESWSLASALAWKRGQKGVSVEYARKAASVGGYSTETVLLWAEAALLADEPEEVDRALGRLDPVVVAGSSRALRARGEAERREAQWVKAISDFSSAEEVDRRVGVSSLAVDEIPLALCLLGSGAPADRERALTILSAWKADPLWGAQALRTLLDDALAHKESQGALVYARALWSHPKFAVGDLASYLAAMAGGEPREFDRAVESLKRWALGNPQKAAQIMSILNRLGRPEMTLSWAEAIPPEVTKTPPLAICVAEALRQSAHWRELDQWVGACHWGKEFEFMRWLYGMLAARQLGDPAKAENLWRTLQSGALLNGGEALVAADSLYGWGSSSEAVALLWSAADKPATVIPALGTLARLYQVRRDAEGQFRVFSRWESLRPNDPDVVNNYVLFATLTGKGNSSDVEAKARSNFERRPGNVSYRATWAFVLCWLGRPGEALRVMSPVSSEWKTSVPVAWSYGMALAGVGRKDEAREVLDAVNPETLSFAAIEWAKTALK